MHKIRAVSEKCRYMQLPLHMRRSVPDNVQRASIKPAKAKLIVRNTKRHRIKHLAPIKANAAPTGTAALTSFIARVTGKGNGGRNIVREVRLPAAAAIRQRRAVSLV